VPIFASISARGEPIVFKRKKGGLKRFPNPPSKEEKKI
jgi:hypothetical protein